MPTPTTITKRVSGALTEGSTQRVITRDAITGALGSDTWGGTWGGFGGTLGRTWGKTWFNTGGASQDAKPTESSTVRVSGAITENTTKRVTGI